MRTPADARETLLLLHGRTVGLDTETVGVNPKEESPVLRGKIFCWTLAWENDQGQIEHAFIPNWGIYEHTILPVFRGWLEDPEAYKVGHNIWSFDKHMFANHGIDLQGIKGDSLRLSKLVNCTKLMQHGLKPLSKSLLGLQLSEYSDLFSRAVRLMDKEYRTTRVQYPKAGPLKGVRTITCKGTVCTFSSTKRELIPLDELLGPYKSRLPSLERYASLDAVAHLGVYNSLWKSAPTRMQDIHTEVWNPMMGALNRMERRGVNLDKEYCTEQHARASADLAAIEEDLGAWAPNIDNWNSHVQTSKFLYEELGLPIPPVKGTMRAIKRTKTDRDTGEYLETPVSDVALYWLTLNTEGHEKGLEAFRRWRKTYRYRGFLERIPAALGPDGRLHTILAPETDTGRLSASKPPLQQIPGGHENVLKGDPYYIRRAFVASPGHKLIVSDFSQLEVYIMAHILLKLFGDSSLADALATGDVYGAIAKQCWPEPLAGVEAADIKHHPDESIRDYRKMAKVVVLATNYGKTVEGLAFSLLDETGNPGDAKHAQALLDAYFAAYPGVTLYHRWIKRYVRERGGVPTLLGRWRPIPEGQDPRRWVREKGERMALNTPIQGSAADVMTKATLRIDQDGELAAAGCVPLLQVHDELVLEAPEHVAEEVGARVTTLMENPGIDLLVPLKAETTVCDNWAMAK